MEACGRAAVASCNHLLSETARWTQCSAKGPWRPRWVFPARRWVVWSVRFGVVFSLWLWPEEKLMGGIYVGNSDLFLVHLWLKWDIFKILGLPWVFPWAVFSSGKRRPWTWVCACLQEGNAGSNRRNSACSSLHSRCFYRGTSFMSLWIFASGL